MALIKTSPEISDITGRVGGDIYKRDASGLHITAKNRYVRKPKTQKQIDQNNWYCAIKRAERTSATEPESPIEEPRKPAVGIYSMDYLLATRQWSEGAPVLVGVVHASMEEPAIKNWFSKYYPKYELESRAIEPYFLEYVNTHHPTMAADWGMTNFEVASLLDSYWEYFRLQLKEPDLLATTHAIEHFEAMIKSNKIRYTRISKPYGFNGVGEGIGINVLLAAFAGIALYIISESVYGTYPGSIHFQKRRVLIEIENTAAFGSLLGRPSANMLDFIFVGPPAFPSFYIDYGRSPGDLNEVFFNPDISVSEIDQHIGYHWVYTWGAVKTRWCREAHLISQEVYRMATDAETLAYFDIPIGFRYPTSDFYDYNMKLFDYWRAWPEEGPRL